MKNLGYIVAAAVAVVLAIALWMGRSNQPTPTEVERPSHAYQPVVDESYLSLGFYGEPMGELTARIPVKKITLDPIANHWKVYVDARWSKIELSDEAYRPAFSAAFRPIDVGSDHIDIVFDNVQLPVPDANAAPATAPTQVVFDGWLTSAREQRKDSFYFHQTISGSKITLNSSRHRLLRLRSGSNAKLKEELAKISNGVVSDTAEVRYHITLDYQP